MCPRLPCGNKKLIKIFIFKNKILPIRYVLHKCGKYELIMKNIVANGSYDCDHGYDTGHI